ncbi:hypothetical protein FRC09_001924 [Ceratobasidium sp. 395]|nr:hypothetical protein FRC09_001924 [Ceratobasidium sp. 395]
MADDQPHSDSVPTMSTALSSRKPIKSTTWSGLKTLLNVLEQSRDSFGPLKSAVAGLSQSIDIFETSVAQEKYSQLRTDLEHLCQDIAGFVGGNTPPSMASSILSLAEEIEKETQAVVMKLQRNPRERYAAAAKGNKEEISDCYLRIRTCLNRLACLPYSSAAKYCSIESDGLGRNGSISNTRVDLLKELLDWAQNICIPNSIYWLNGTAGTGKTTVAYSLCEQLQDDGILAASFFCSQKSLACREIGRILPSIAYQLSLFSHPFRYALSQAIEMDQDIHNQSISRQFKSLITLPLQQVAHALLGDLVIVIDGLDECEDAEGIGRFVSVLLKQIPDLPIKLFIASRPIPPILDHMRSDQAASVQFELRLDEIDRSVVRSDIRTYLKAELDVLDPEPAGLDLLAERSGEQFVFAAAVVRQVKHPDRAISAQKLQRIISTLAAPPGDRPHDDRPCRQPNRLSNKMPGAIDTSALRDGELEENSLPHIEVWGQGSVFIMVLLMLSMFSYSMW